jgi:hypothetical protein
MKHILVLPSMRQLILLFGLCTLTFTAEGQGNLSFTGPAIYNSQITVPANQKFVEFDTIVVPNNHVLKLENVLIGFYNRNGGALTNTDPIVLPFETISLEIFNGSTSNSSLIYIHPDIVGSLEFKNFPFWIGSGIYYCRLRRNLPQPNPNYFHCSLHGLLFSNL